MQVNNSIEITTSVINLIETAVVLESQDISLIANLLDSVSNRTEDLQQEEVSSQVMKLLHVLQNQSYYYYRDYSCSVIRTPCRRVLKLLQEENFHWLHVLVNAFFNLIPNMQMMKLFPMSGPDGHPFHCEHDTGGTSRGDSHQPNGDPVIHQVSLCCMLCIVH